ncbi:hypothetical protein A8H34_17330 [Burkholderia thailandensis]|nr:hypothetical protein A8H34_17330 [Burkholderia thailandensis]PNE85825.1 hypothetical protein A8H30_16980 [Burkholderia thailandensis]
MHGAGKAGGRGAARRSIGRALSRSAGAGSRDARRSGDTVARRYADTPIRRYADTPIRRYARTQPGSRPTHHLLRRRTSGRASRRRSRGFARYSPNAFLARAISADVDESCFAGST